MILCLRTDAPTVELSVCLDHDMLAQRIWKADRTLARDILSGCESLMADANCSWGELTGIVVYQGPGSFTGLRIGIAVANTVAYAQSIPIVGTTGDDWRTHGLTRLACSHDDQHVMPKYGAEPRLTSPKK